MGGSGGGFFSGGTSPEELARRTRETEEKAHDDRFEIEVSAFLASELAEFNDRNVDGFMADLSQSTHTLTDSAMWTRSF